ncbi:hypothetical protein Back11_04780 [Paenibacillus baekrokdamisoli]|uniref:Uncharacterized protein n=1 Tax=Paenibacillus baekrokdamisoli TaxID=1712516 RepID=A0A3G9J351_9BACL|nr:HD domain-containing protein [Paenibacillus baekrokdamisoli]MBB3067681.1 (p)ppGpp synthase/HD superfamily hydrolase [Paenibacillus baekrokdamisoli]BBH19133.1 hypothetical protein Back11_04780 [Paenibacillus baekrokdamisoli]
MDITTALIIAATAHKGQYDKGNKPYILHPLAVMNRVHTLEEKIVAILHDVVEDTSVTLEVLSVQGFTPVMIDAIDRLTKRESESYMDFIQRAKENEISRNVKIADIQENMDLSRLTKPTDKDHERVEKYQKALHELMVD